MKRLGMIITVLGVFFVVGCSSAPEVERATLGCRAPFKGGSFVGLYSFRVGDMTDCFMYPDKFPDPDETVDLAYYIDDNDCAQGALIGIDDHGGYLFLIGHKSWRELVKLGPPAEDAESVEAIAPVTKDKEGLAFWVKTRGGEYVLMRIRVVQPALYADLVSGGRATVELEWVRLRAGVGE